MNTDASATGFTARPMFTAAEMAVLKLDGDKNLGYLAASGKWVDNHGEPLTDDMQTAAHQLCKDGNLPAFEEFFLGYLAPDSLM